MSSHGSREETRRLSVGTLAIASIASATAALIVSQFWQGGTPIAAAVTPVLVALISEMLHRPSAKIAEKVTVDRAALRPDPGAPAPEEARRTMPLDPADPGGDVRVYRSGPRHGLPLKGIALTGGLAFVIAVAALTLPELIGGRSLLNSDKQSTFGGGQRTDDGDEERQQEPPAQTDEQEEPEPESEKRPEEAEKQPKSDKRPEPETTTPAPAPKPRQAPEEEDTAPTEPAPEEPALPGTPPVPQ